MMALRAVTSCLCPGVQVKTWSVFPVDDGLEENHETFTVTLKHPRNAVLGHRTSARVEILDPRGGEDHPGTVSSRHLLTCRLLLSGRCDPIHLQLLAPPPQANEDRVTNIQAELILENQHLQPKTQQPFQFPVQEAHRAGRTGRTGPTQGTPTVESPQFSSTESCFIHPRRVDSELV